MTKKQYKKVAVGGTFDRFHKGHEELLATAFDIGEHVVIGITDQSMTKEKVFSRTITSFRDRKHDVEAFLAKKGWSDRASIVLLRDVLGPLRTDKAIEALVIGPRVDQDTIDQVKKRVTIVKCKTVTSKDNSYLSSTRIRQGEVNRAGDVYNIPESDLHLPQALRPELKNPLGDMVYDTGALETRYAPLIIAVGDATTKRLIDDGLYIDFAIVDLMTGREKSPYTLNDLGITKDTHAITNVSNKAGMITAELFKTVKRDLQALSEDRTRPRVIVVSGEEDLATLPALYCAPLESFVWYGQPNTTREHPEGLVGIEVTEKTKTDTAYLLSKFKRA